MWRLEGELSCEKQTGSGAGECRASEGAAGKGMAGEEQEGKTLRTLG